MSSTQNTHNNEINNTNEASKFTAIKDQAVGTIKETLGNVLGNEKMQLEGRAQKVHGHNEYQFAKAYKEGETEPEKFQQAYHSDVSGEQVDFNAPIPSTIQSTHPAPMSAQAPPPPPEYASEAPQSQPIPPVQPVASTHSSAEPSQTTAMKDQAMGSVKQAVGSATNNPSMEIAGKAQTIHGHNEAEFAKARKEGRVEPEHFEQGTKMTDHAEGKVEGDKVSSMSAMKDKTIGSIKETFGSVTGNTNTELAGKAQQMHGRNEAEFVKAQKEGLNEPEHYAHGSKTVEHAHGEVEGQNVSSLGAIKDRAMGSVKEMLGSATGNQNMELKGKAQNIHGRNEAEFAKAQKQGLSEPEYFAQGTKVTDRADGKVEGEKVSSMSAMKDKTMGSIKETFGSVTGNTNTELAGKAQQMHGRNEAEFAKAQKEGLNEPEHYAHGTKTTEHAQGEVVSNEPSKMSGWKDQAVGAVKESFGSATNNQKMEIEGKAQKIQGSTQGQMAETQNRNTINA
jgi:uncharacterized protein YjbJ (UPF0337 family)